MVVPCPCWHTLDFTVEAEAKPAHEHAQRNMFSLEGYLDIAGVAGCLHCTPTTWFDGHCHEMLQDYVPLLNEEPLNSALFVAAAHQRSRGISKEDFLQTGKMSQMMAVLPRPMGEHAERLVVVHGDLLDANVLHMPEGSTILFDFETSVVSSAVQDFAHISQESLVAKLHVAAYLEAMTGNQPSEEEVYRLLLKARISHHGNKHTHPRFLSLTHTHELLCSITLQPAS